MKPKSISVRLGLMGAGHMGGSIVGGLLQKKLLGSSRVTIYEKLEDKKKEFVKKWKTSAASSIKGLVVPSDVLILAIKPQDLVAAGAELQPYLNQKKLIISILAGTPLSKLKKILGTKCRIVRAMPNLGASVGRSVTAFCGNVSAGDFKTTQQIFEGCGVAFKTEERHLDLVTALSGSGPAYFFYLMEAIEKKALKSGLPEVIAKILAVETAAGAGLLAASSKYSPAELRTMVTSRGGTTEAALRVLERNNTEDIFESAFQAACQRAAELAES